MTLKVAYRPVLHIILPRICSIGFNIAQQLLNYRVISLIDDTTNDQIQFVGRALIEAALLVYLGVLISTAAYNINLSMHCNASWRASLLVI